MTRPTIGDMALTAVFLAAGVWLAVAHGPRAPQGEAAVIRSVSDSTRIVPLSEDRVVVVKGALGVTEVRIEDGYVDFISSPCPHKICIERGRVALEGDYIVCVPNGVSVRIEGESAFDAVVP